MSKIHGFRFKNNKLYAFSWEGVMILEAWPKLEAIRKEDDGFWQKFEPHFRVVKPYRPQKVKKEPNMELAFDYVPRRPLLADQRRRAFDRFRLSMPKDVAKAVEKYRSRQWGILQIMRHCEGVVELARLNPALAFALGNFHSFGRKITTIEEAAAISMGRRRDIAGAFGFPGTEAAVKVLAKISHECVTVEILLALRLALLQEASMTVLSHMQKLNAGVLALITDPDLLEACTPALLEEVAEAPAEKYEAPAAEAMRHTLQLLNAIDPAASKPKIQSLAKLHSMHMRAALEFLNRQHHISGNPQLPAPPLPGTSDIEPILTTTDLLEEGKVQKKLCCYLCRTHSGGNRLHLPRPPPGTCNPFHRQRRQW
jgi:hypothetical protein